MLGTGCRCVDEPAKPDTARTPAPPKPKRASRPSAPASRPAQRRWALPLTVGGARPARVYAPRALREGRAGDRRYPLVVLLHGYGYDAAPFAQSIGYRALVERAPLLLLSPRGRLNRVKRRFWRADRLCCDFFDEGKDDDDAHYVRRLIERVIATYPVDRRRIYAVGHSNGGNMAFRLACFASDLLAAIVSFAGSTERRGCKPDHPLSVLHLHGDADPVVPYRPVVRHRPLGRIARLPGAVATLSMWADMVGCSGKLGNATAVAPHISARSFSGCPPQVDATLWTVRGGDHTTRRLPRFAERTWRWLMAHPKAPDATTTRRRSPRRNDSARSSGRPPSHDTAPRRRRR